jgi:hypothetical protein
MTGLKNKYDLITKKELAALRILREMRISERGKKANTIIS